jgi:biotin carboxylase
MAQHLLILDANLPGIETITAAKRRGLQVSFIRSGYRKYPETEAVRAMVYDVDALVSIVDSTDADALHAAARLLHQFCRVDAAVCLLEPCIDTAAAVCARLAIPFTDAAAVAAARDKARTRAILHAVGLRSPRCCRVASAEEARAAAAAIGGMVVVKPQTGYDSLLASVAITPEAAAAAAQRLLDRIGDLPPPLHAQLRKGIMVESHLDGPLISAELGRRGGRSHRFMLSAHIRARDDECVEIGFVMPAGLAPAQAEACFAYAEAVVEALGLDLGIFHIEMILTPAGPVLVEANARLMGGGMPALYRMLTGEDIQDRLLDIHLGLPLPARRPPIRGFVASRTIMARQDCRLPSNFDLDWLRDYAGAGLVLSPYRLQPHAAVRRLENIAEIRLRGESFAKVDHVADAVLARFERCLGIPLLR